MRGSLIGYAKLAATTALWTLLEPWQEVRAAQEVEANIVVP